MMVEAGAQLSLRHHCVLLGLSRPALYYRPVRVEPYALELMALSTASTCARRFTGRTNDDLAAGAGPIVNRQRMQRLMQPMGLAAIYQRAPTSLSAPEHRIYPYLCVGW
jgi:putative transposase